MSARDDILGNIRARTGRSAPASGDVDERLAEPVRGPIPARATGSPAERWQRFTEMARAASADSEELAALDDLPELVARLCDEEGFARRVATAPLPALVRLDWSGAGIDAEQRAGRPDDRVCVSHALCGVAETGTLVLVSGPQSPVTLNFLPDVHVVALAADSIVGSYEEAWDLIRAGGNAPRAVNWITGPSRSADIEQSIQLGAHGPVRLAIAIYSRTT